ncbi:MAG: PilZ domain-containing protein [Desulfobacterales bacterium]|nr:PilZ domain-containing protein [Desulfobacterales bacterium]
MKYNGNQKNIKIYIDKEGFSAITCPECNFVKRADISKFKGISKPLKVKCKCGVNFTCTIEFRQFFRKASKLAGEFTVVGKRSIVRILIEDVSQQGLGFSLIEPCEIALDDLLDVTFTLDNRHRTVIRKRVIIRSIREKFIGCEYTEKSGYDKELRFYLMP